MPLDFSPLQPSQPYVSPFARLMNIQQRAEEMRGAQEQRMGLAEQRQQQAAASQALAEKRQYDLSVQTGADEAIGAGGGVRETTIAHAMKFSPQSVAPLNEHFDNFEKRTLEIKAQKAKLNDMRMDQVSQLAESAINMGGTPDVVQKAIDYYAEQHTDPDDVAGIAKMREQFANTPPDQIMARLAQMRDIGPSYQARQAKINERGPVKVNPGETVLGPDNKPVFTAPAKEEHSPAYKEWQDAKAAGGTQSFEQYQNADANRKRPVVNIHGPNAPGAVKMSDEAVDYAAAQVRILGNGSGVLTRLNDDDRKRILNKVADQAKALGNSPAATIQRQAAFKSDGASLTQISKMKSSAEAYEAKAAQQADLILGLSQKVGRTKFPVVNAAIMSGKLNLSGDKDAQLFVNGITTFTAEYAKIIEGSTGSAAGSSDSARKATERLLNPNLNQKTFEATVRQMQAEMKYTANGYDSTIAHITERMGGAPGGAAPTPATIGRFKVEIK